MEVVHERCCGLDIHKKTVVACLLTPGERGQPRREVRSFGTTTRALLELGRHLRSAPPPSPPRPAAMGQFVEPVVDIQKMAAIESPAPIESRGQAIARVEAEADDYLAGVASRLRAGGLGVELSVLMDADVPAAIVRFARERGFDIVAMSTHGRSGLREVISGSVASAVLRAGALPVLLVRPGKYTGSQSLRTRKERRAHRISVSPPAPHLTRGPRPL